MINAEIETLFVNTYIQKQYRERLIFELKDTSSKTHKRSRNAFRKFSHLTQDYIIPRLVAVSSEKLTEQDALSFVKNMVDDKTCYFMNAYEGDEMSIDKAIERAFNDLGASIIIYKQRFAIIKEETEIGAPLKYILVNK
ncbi:MAG: hypothetical protein K2M64_00350 [Clostridia bacterium]|nr:hypothetical protein [Clostridia bacterium]